MCRFIHVAEYRRALSQQTPADRLPTRCYCGKEAAERRLHELERQAGGRCPLPPGLASQIERAREDIEHGVLHAWRDVRFVIELELRMVITDLSAFYAASRARRKYTDAEGGSSLIAVAIEPNSPLPRDIDTFPLNDDTDVQRLDGVIVLTRLPNTKRETRDRDGVTRTKTILNFYVPPRRRAEFDELELAVAQTELDQRCAGKARVLSERWLCPTVVVPCPGHLTRAPPPPPPPDPGPAWLQRCLPIPVDQGPLLRDADGRPQLVRCRRHLRFALCREDVRLAVSQEVIALRNGCERTPDNDRAFEHHITVAAGTADPRERAAALAAVRRLPWADSELKPAHRLRRDAEHPSAKVLRARYPGCLTWDGVPIRWHDIPKEVAPDSYVCGRCQNVFGKGHLAEDCPSAARPGWVPVYQRPMPHGLIGRQIKVLSWSDPVELLELARWVNAQGNPVIARSVYDAHTEQMIIDK